MSELKYNFLNWNPDQDDFDNQGMIVADNMIHDTEGFLPVGIQTAGAFSTVQSAAVIAHAIPYGNAGQLLHCFLNTAPGNAQMRLIVAYESPVIGAVPIALDVVTSSTLASFPGNITSFSLVDTGSAIFVTAEAEFDAATGTPEILNITGYGQYN